jgi:hypothetical protein
MMLIQQRSREGNFAVLWSVPCQETTLAVDRLVELEAREVLSYLRAYRVNG